MIQGDVPCPQYTDTKTPRNINNTLSKYRTKVWIPISWQDQCCKVNFEGSVLCKFSAHSFTDLLCNWTKSTNKKCIRHWTLDIGKLDALLWIPHVNPTREYKKGAVNGELTCGVAQVSRPFWHHTWLITRSEGTKAGLKVRNEHLVTCQ